VPLKEGLGTPDQSLKAGHGWPSTANVFEYMQYETIRRGAEANNRRLARIGAVGSEFERGNCRFSLVDWSMFSKSRSTPKSIGNRQRYLNIVSRSDCPSCQSSRWDRNIEYPSGRGAISLFGPKSYEQTFKSFQMPRLVMETFRLVWMLDWKPAQSRPEWSF
jgi:hypothetical protein